LIIRNKWLYNDRGIFDKTHLRFFTIKNIKEMFNNSDLKIVKIKRKYRIIEKPSALNALSIFFAIPIIKNFITHQYLILAVKK
jgi:hypothetical protein